MKRIEFKDIILFENEHLIFVNKPAGLSSLSERLGEKDSLHKLGVAYNPDIVLCHRLDKETSGVLIIAKNLVIYREMAMLFEKRAVMKIYHCIISGVHHFEDLNVDLPLSVTRNGFAKIDHVAGKPSLTIVNSIAQYRHYTLLACYPVSGRLHQIRMHLASQNVPIVSDVNYGGKLPYLSQIKRKFNLSKWEEEEKPLMERVALHAFNIRFEMLGEKYSVSAPYPKDMEVFVKQLEKFDK